MRHRRSTAAALAGLAVLLGGCGAATEGTAASQGSRPSVSVQPVQPVQPHRAGPAGLVGIWRVTGTDEPDGTLLRLSGTDLSLWRDDCGAQFGSWRAEADGQLFLADSRGMAVGTCASADREPPWLHSSTRYAQDRDGWRLLDALGHVRARLVPGGPIKPRPDLDPSLSTRPVLDDATLAALATPAPLPTGLRPTSARALVGRWTLADVARSSTVGPAFLAVAADGTWQASDGCNESQGRWLSGPGSRLLATSGPSTMIGCENVDLAGWWSTAARAGLAGGRLVLVDRDGRELVRLTRTPPGPQMTHGPAAPR